VLGDALGPTLRTLGPHWEALGTLGRGTHSGTSWVLHSVLLHRPHTGEESWESWQPLGTTTEPHSASHWVRLGSTREREDSELGEGAGCSTGTAALGGRPELGLGRAGGWRATLGEELVLPGTAIRRHLGSTGSALGATLGVHWVNWGRSALGLGPALGTVLGPALELSWEPHSACTRRTRAEGSRGLLGPLGAELGAQAGRTRERWDWN
jgi:hypothetical protein